MIRLNFKKVMALIALALLLATAVFIGISKMTELQEGTGSETVSVVRELETLPEFSETGSERRYVYVTGAVSHEGVYEVSETARVFEVLELAGGA